MHVAEVSFVLNNFASFNATCHPPPEEMALSKLMGSMWANFARTGIPHKKWKPYTDLDDSVLKFTASTTRKFDYETGYRREQCDLLEAVLPSNEQFTKALSTLQVALLTCQKQDVSALIV